MSFYLWVSFAAWALVVSDLIRGKIFFGDWVAFVRSNATRRDNPKDYWISVAWRVAIAGGLSALAWFHVPEPR
jgi:hypothetical protein